MDLRILTDDDKIITRNEVCPADHHNVNTKENLTSLTKLGLHNITYSQIPAHVELNSEDGLVTF
jgi:hypothetical protein